MDVKAKYESGQPIKAIARETGISRNTVRKMVRGKHQGTYTRKEPEKRILDEFEPYLRQNWQERNAHLLYEDITSMGYAGSEVTVRRFRARLKREHGLVAAATVRFETPPGKQAQVDWGEVGRLRDDTGRLRKLYVFVYVLGHSRHTYAEFTFSMKLPELIRCHQNAFAADGGWPAEILTDNMAQVRLPSGKLNALFADFAAHHGFAVKTHKPYRPRTKGKVERMVGYIKGNFMPSRSFTDIDDANRQLATWLAQANARVHSTTKAVPAELLRTVELPALTALDAAPRYVVAETAQRSVSRESTVAFGGNRYSVPPKHLGTKVLVEARAGSIRVRLGDTIIAEHARAQGKGREVIDPAHLQALWDLSAEQIHPAAGATARDLTAPPDVQRRALTVYEEASR